MPLIMNKQFFSVINCAIAGVALIYYAVCSVLLYFQQNLWICIACF